MVNWSEIVVAERAMKVAEAAAGRVGPVFVEKLFRSFFVSVARAGWFPVACCISFSVWSSYARAAKQVKKKT